MSKFKVGDRVRILKSDGCDIPVGSLATLTEEYTSYWTMTMDDPALHNGSYHTQPESDFELVTEDNNNEEDTMSIQTDIINQNLSDNQEYLIRKGVTTPDGNVVSTATLLQVLLAMNEDAVVKFMKEAEAKAGARRKGTVDEVTPTNGQ